MHKASEYNFFFESNDGYVLAYNSFSNCFARVEKSKYSLVKGILNNPNSGEKTEEFENLKKDLIRGCFLIEKDFNEIEILKMKNKLGRFSTDALSLTIAPTLACNFKCNYCFEEKSNCAMDDKTEDALIKFVEKRMGRLEQLYVIWFGGEPTLKIDAIERLTYNFQRLCKENKVHLAPMSIITNGYLLTKENAEILKKLNISNVQTTIDGPPEIHDKRRKLYNGMGTFNRIIENIKASADLLRIVVRINIDRENVDYIDRLFDILKEEGLLNKILFYFGQIQANTDACSDVSALCFSRKQHSDLIVNLLKKAKERGNIHIKYPSLQHFGVCTADKLNGFVIAPNGYIFKCWNEIGLDKMSTVGTIFDEKPQSYHITNLAKYLNWDPFQKESCIKCKFLPICSGGCIYSSINDDDVNCTEFKFNLEEMLLLKYDELMAAKQTNSKKNKEV